MRKFPFVDNRNQEAGEELTSILLMKGIRRSGTAGRKSVPIMLQEADIRDILDAHQELGVPVG